MAVHIIFAPVQQYKAIKSTTGMPESNISGIKSALKAHRSAIIIIHHNADPDAMGSAVALARGLSQLGVSSEVCAPLGLSLQSRNILTQYPYHVKEGNDIRFQKLIFIVDTSTPEQIGNIALPADAVVVILDHHEEGKLFGRANFRFLKKDSHATAFIVFELFDALNLKITAEIALFLLCGIVADTGFLRMVTAKELKATAKLLEVAGVELEGIYGALSVREDISERIAKLKAMKRMKVFRLGDVIVAFAASGSFESQTALSIMKQGADIAFVENIDAKKPEYRISGRMKQHLAEKLDLSKLIKAVEPIIEGSAGGHPTAASANGKNARSSARVEAKLLESLEKVLGQKRKQLI